MLQLKMERQGLDGLPEIPLPEGYRLRSYQPGDEAALATIYELSDLGSATAEGVKKNLLGHPCFRPDRILVVEHEGRVVGTAAAWVEPTDPGAGYLHMVGVLPEHQGKRLGKFLTVEALRYSQREGFETHRLVTDDWRDAAIRLPDILANARELPLPPRRKGMLARLFRAFGL